MIQWHNLRNKIAILKKQKLKWKQGVSSENPFHIIGSLVDNLLRLQAWPVSQIITNVYSHVWATPMWHFSLNMFIEPAK